MPEHSVARRYAQALLDVAVEAQAIDQVGQDLARFAQLLDAHGGLLRASLCTPVFTLEERSKVLEQLLPRMGIHLLAANLIRLTNEKGRLPVIGDIASSYRDLADALAKRARVKVATAAPLSPQLEAEVRAALQRVTGKDVILEPSVDPSLIGGLVARHGSKVYDSSLRTRLQNLRKDLLSHSAEA